MKHDRDEFNPLQDGNSSGPRLSRDSVGFSVVGRAKRGGESRRYFYGSSIGQRSVLDIVSADSWRSLKG